VQANVSNCYIKCFSTQINFNISQNCIENVNCFSLNLCGPESNFCSAVTTLNSQITAINNGTASPEQVTEINNLFSEILSTIPIPVDLSSLTGAERAQ